MAKVRAIPSFARQAALEICAWSLGCIDVMALQQFARSLPNGRDSLRTLEEGEEEEEGEMKSVTF